MIKDVGIRIRSNTILQYFESSKKLKVFNITLYSSGSSVLRNTTV